MKELSWEHPLVQNSPENKAVILAEVEDWNRELATNFGFPDLIPAESAGKMFHIAVGKNTDGEVVGAKLLQETAVDLPMREVSLNFLNQRAQMIFGLSGRNYPDDD